MLDLFVDQSHTQEADDVPKILEELLKEQNKLVDLESKLQATSIQYLFESQILHGVFV